MCASKGRRARFGLEGGLKVGQCESGNRRANCGQESKGVGFPSFRHENFDQIASLIINLGDLISIGLDSHRKYLIAALVVREAEHKV